MARYRADLLRLNAKSAKGRTIGPSHRPAGARHSAGRRSRSQRNCAVLGMLITRVVDQVVRQGRHPLGIVSEESWARIDPLLPVAPPRTDHPDRKALDVSKVLYGVLVVLYTGLPWKFLPHELGFGSATWQPWLMSSTDESGNREEHCAAHQQEEHRKHSVP
jgi:hypothetical protein